MAIQKIEIGDCREVIKKYPDNFFDTLVTSPPYWSKRTYGTEPLVWDGKSDCNHIWMGQLKAKRHDAGETNPSKEAWYKEEGQISKDAGCFCSLCGAWKGEIGNEPTPELFIKHILDIFTIIASKIKDTGSMWINLGDSYFGSGTGQDKSMSIGKQTEGSFISSILVLNTRDKPQKHPFLKPKSLCMVPERFAMGMLERGFILRNCVIWHKFNHMPGSWEDRLTNSYEYVYHFVKKSKYFYDLDVIRVPHKTQSLERYQRAVNLGVFAQTTKYGDRHLMGMPQHAPKWFVEGANTGINNKEPYKDNNPHRTRLYEGKFEGMGGGSEQFGSPRARNERQSDSKFLKSDQKTASPGARGILSERDGKLTTFVRTKLQECGQHLKDKLKQSNYTIKQLADVIGIKETTLLHYFRTDLSGQAIPDMNTWEALQELIGIGNYDDYVSEEIRNALPQPHPLGKNPGDFISIGIDDLTEEETKSELLNMQYQWRKLHPEDWDIGDIFNINTQGYREAHFACVDENTEILTWSGWKDYKTLKIDDKISTFDILSDKIHYHVPYNIHIYDYNGILIHIKNQWIDQLVTPNHRVLLKYMHSTKKKISDSNWKYVNAEDITPFSGVLIPNAGKYQEGIHSIGIEKAELLGWIITKGHILSNGSIQIYQSISANKQKVERIKNLLDITEQKYTFHSRSRKYKDRISKEAIFSLNKTQNDNSWIFKWIDLSKKPSWELLHLRYEELYALFNGLIDGDGYRRIDGRISFKQNNLYTHDWFRCLSTHLGMRTSLHTRTRIHQGATTHVTMKKYSQIHQSTFKECISKEHYCGIVWCPELHNSNFIAKRNNKIYITGNTFPLELVRIPILSTCPLYICKKCGKPRERIIQSVTLDRTATDGHGSGELSDGNFGSSVHQQVGWSDCGCQSEFESGWVLDPFCGSGTTLQFCRDNNRNVVGIDLNPDYKKMAIKRARLDEPQVKPMARTEIL